MVAGFGRSSGEVLVWVSSIHPIYGIYPTLSYFAHLSHPFSSRLILEFRAKAAFEVHPLVIKNALPSSVGITKKSI